MSKRTGWGCMVFTAMALVYGCGITDTLPPQEGTQTRIQLLPGNRHHEGHLAADMRFMLQSLTAILSLEVDATIDDAERLLRIQRELDNLTNTAQVVKGGKEITNYSNSSPYVGSFLHDVRMAREFSELSPPDYQPAAGLIRSCQHCHQNI